MVMQKLGVAKEVVINAMLFFWPSLQQYKAWLDRQLFEEGDPILEYAIYICPLCLKNFIYVQPGAEVVSAEFSSDHFPPKNAGGYVKSLVCKDCNNTAGHEFDFVTKDFLIQRSFEQRIPGTVIKAKVQVSGLTGNYRSEISINDNQDMEFSFLPELNKKAVPLQEWLKEGLERPDWKADINITKTDQDKVEKAFLKTAYLACFHQWGYEFVFSDTGKFIREVLAGERKYPYKHVPAFVFDTPERLAVIPTSLSFISFPETWHVFTVQIPLKLKDNNYECVASVLIPGPGRWNDLERLNETIDHKIDQQVSFTPLHPAMLRKQYNGYSQDAATMYVPATNETSW